MPIYIDIPPEYEDLLHELADTDDRLYRHEAVHLLKWAITERMKKVQQTASTSAVAEEPTHAPAE